MTLLDTLFRVWEIVDAVGSAAGALLAGLAGLIAYRLFRVESNRDAQARLQLERRDAEQRRAQAAAVGMWEEQDDNFCLQTVVVTNLSPLPIYSIEIFLFNHATYEDDTYTYPALAPGKEIRLSAPEGFRSGNAEAHLTFLDNADIEWHRSTTSRLSDVTKAKAGRSLVISQKP